MAGLDESAQRPPVAVAVPSFGLLGLLPPAVPGLPNPEEGESEGSQRPSKDTSACSALFSTLCRITVAFDAEGGVPLRCSCVLVAPSSGKRTSSAGAKGLLVPLF